MRASAAVISIVFHPLLMPLLCVVFAGQFDPMVSGRVHPEQLRITYIIMALSTIAFPAINVLLLRWYGAVTSFDVQKRTERFAPYISSVFFFVLGYILLRRGALPVSIHAIMLGCTVSLVALTVLNTKLKISAHATGVGGLAGTAVGLFQIHGWFDFGLLGLIILLTGLVLSARLVLKMHTALEVYAGVAAGFGVLYLFVSQTWVI
ncbi:MAG: hypothetical protein ABR572_02195 [Cryomorphaceae bacterium]|nr:hypothetical protein [Flavobacteriales bacterium]